MNQWSRKSVTSIAVIVALGLTIGPAADAQLDGLKKLGSKVKDAAVGGANGVASGVSGKPTTEKSQTTEAAKDSKLKDGETAVLSTSLSEADATAKVKAYFNSKDIDFTVNADTGRIITDWYSEHRCGPGFNRCANRGMVRILTEDGKTVLRVQVFERKREAGMNDKPWKENSTSKGKETGELAGMLEALLQR